MELVTKSVIGIFCLIILGCSRDSGSWQAELHEVDSKMALTIRLTPSNEKENTIVFREVDIGVLKPRFYNLPQEATKIPKTELSFSDTTLLPGRATLKVHGHSIDIMERNLIIDGIKYGWNLNNPIIINRKRTRNTER